MVDLIALGGGLVLTLVYVLVPRLQEMPLAQQFLPNAAVGIIGTWLSIRIIERIISRRDAFHDNRRVLLNHLVSLAELFYYLLYGPYEWRLKEAADQLSFIEDLLPRKKPYLTPTEVQKLEVVIQLAHEFLVPSTQLVALDLDLSQARHRLRLAIVEANRHREAITDGLNLIVMHYKFQSIERPVSLKEFLPAFLESVSAARPYLGQADGQILSEVVRDLTSQETFTYQDLSSIVNDTRLHAAPRITLEERDWYASLAVTRDLLFQTSSEAEPRWREALSRVEESLEKDSNLLGEHPAELAQMYVADFHELVGAAAETRVRYNTFRKCLTDLKSDISFESPAEY